MKHSLLFFRRLSGLILAFWRTFRATQKLRALQKLENPPSTWDDLRIQAISREWGQKVLRDLNVSVQVEGSPIEGPAIFVGNHLSYIDIIALYSIHHLCFVSKAEVGRWPIIGPATRIAGSILVERGSSRSRIETAQTLSRAILEEHKQVCIFPEGTTSIEGKDWRRGVFRIAHEHGLRVQPMGFVYAPARRAAYIDDDTLFFHMWNLICSDKTELIIKFFEARKIEDVEADAGPMEKEVRTWVDAHLKKQGYFNSTIGYVE
jgi:1-acyl-sn-glycerol-3-phosphate acyltransferase